jgi:hypothetical protein
MGQARLNLFADRIEVVSGRGTMVIPAEEVVASEIERNFKLEIALADHVLRCDFVFGGSALQWHDILSGRSALGPLAPNLA